MIIKKAEFVTSVGYDHQLTPFTNEIALVGKSNVGKSSLINFLCNQKKIAKTSKDPGRTRLINYFSINGGEFTLVDLPGYGFARVSDAEKRKWGNLIENYLKNSNGLRHIFFLVDSRHEASNDDMLMLRYLYFYRIPFSIIATKVDKLSNNEQKKTKQMLAKSLGVGVDNIILSSAADRSGESQILAKIQEILDNTPTEINI